MAKKEDVEVKEVKETKESVFSKAAILASTRYENRKDVLGVILDDEKEYSIDEVDALLEKFMKGQVK